MISLRIALAISFWVAVSFSWSAANQARASATLRRVDMEMSSPAILTAERLGLEAGAVAHLARLRATGSGLAPRASTRISVWSMRRLRLPMTPSNGFLTS